MSSLLLVACSLRLAACSLGPDPEAIASARWRSSPSGCLDAGSSDLLRWSSRWLINHLNAGLSLDPDPGTAAQWFVRAVNNFAGTIDYNFVPIRIWFVSLHRNDWFVVSVRFIPSDDVLVYVYIFFHFYLSVMPELMTWVGFILTGNRYPNHELRWPVYPGASWRLIGLCRASSSFSCLPSSAAFAINAFYTLYRKIPYMSNFILSYPQLVAWSLLLETFILF